MSKDGMDKDGRNKEGGNKEGRVISMESLRRKREMQLAAAFRDQARALVEAAIDSAAHLADADGNLPVELIEIARADSPEKSVGFVFSSHTLDPATGEPRSFAVSFTEDFAEFARVGIMGFFYGVDEEMADHVMVWRDDAQFESEVRRQIVRRLDDIAGGRRGGPD